VTAPPADDFWAPLRRFTPARIGLCRAGDALGTGQILELETAHARARDAVHVRLDTDALKAQLRKLGLGEPAVVASLAGDRSEYLRRPDLGRQPASLESLPAGDHDLGLVLADGLSPRAVSLHGYALTQALTACFAGSYSVAPPVVATQARVALGDHVGHRMGVRTVIVIIGERPGLSVSDSLGVYLTHRPRPGRRDSERNCVSNIHPRGLSFARAAGVVASLVAGARRLGLRALP
jgi:ethanolamine ammonia-lyase small subunit